ncbi:MAG: hemolysin III family protein [Candidatus Hydrogenedentes bacterium]|nr:hemolysin III family protein [Candidatus Hydrogenedentota bacterium]
MAEELTSRYTRGEEYANIGTHAVGIVLSIVALVLMVLFAAENGDPYFIVAVSIFGATLILLYLTSTLYHSVRHPKVKHVFRVFDHVCIYLLIAGSYTPFTLVTLRGGWGWTLFGLTWGLALFGIIFKIFFTKRFSILSTFMYIALGWLVVIAIKPVVLTVPAGGLAWLVAGGLLYTFGVLFYLWRRIPYHHAIWHLFVMAGSFCHFLAVYYYVMPPHAV